jgi:hypothetical protein
VQLNCNYLKDLIKKGGARIPREEAISLFFVIVFSKRNWKRIIHKIKSKKCAGARSDILVNIKTQAGQSL